MENNKEIKKLTDEDKKKLKELLDLLRSSNVEREEDFLCTHCHCRVCTSADKNKE